MKTLKLISLIFCTLLFGCGAPTQNDNVTEQKESRVDSVAIIVPSTESNLDDKEQLQALIRKLYTWIETEGKNGKYFDPVIDDTLYVGIDSTRHAEAVAELLATGFFSDEFIRTYNRIAHTLDTALRSGSMEWLVGDLPPFGNDANPWCDCQAYPDDYWEKLIVRNLSIVEDTASFAWVWGDMSGMSGEPDEYKVRAIKKDGIWRVSYLQGFDYDEYLPQWMHK